MTRGAPDFYQYKDTQQYAGMGNLAELAARLDQRNIYDRRGDVIFWDDFEQGIDLWLTVPLGTGADVSVVVANSRFGDNVLRLTGGSDGSMIATAKRLLPYPPASRIGLSCYFAFDTDCDEFKLSLRFWSGATRYTATLRYTEATEKWAVQTDTNTYVDIDLPALYAIGTVIYYPVKFVIDISTWTYQFVQVGYDTVDISSLTPFAWTTASNQYMDIICSVLSDTGQNAVAYVDNIRLTANNPAS